MDVRRIGTEIYRLFEEKIPSRTGRKKASTDVSAPEPKGVVTEISLTNLAENREKKIEEIKFLIENGLYKIDSKSIAENLIEELIND